MAAEYKDVGCHLNNSCLDCNKSCYLITTPNCKRRSIDTGAIIKLRDAGMSPKDISTKLGITTNVVYKRIKRWKPKPTIKASVIKLHMAGLGVQEISRDTGATISYVRLIIHKYLKKPLGGE